jgi:hypothetical protein
MSRHILIWLMVVFFTPLFLPYLVTPQLMTRSINADYQSALAILGDKPGFNRLLLTFYRTHMNTVRDFAHEFQNGYDDSDEFRASGDSLGEKIADLPDIWASSVKLEVYSMALRLVVVYKWFPWLALPLLMAIVAGVYERKLKAVTFSPASPPIYNSCIHSLIALFFLFVLWILCPVPLPMVLMPALSAVACWLVSLAISHYPASLPS